MHIGIEGASNVFVIVCGIASAMHLCIMADMVKTHQAVVGTIADPEALRSLCGRSSGRVWRIETLENGQNLNDTGEQVTCKFCLRIMEAKRKLASWT